MSTHNVAGGERFPKRARLRRRREFLAVQQRASGKVHSRHFLVLLAPNGQEPAKRRIGITVSKKVGTAVKRNRIKRLVREFIRRQGEGWLPAARDVVIIAKRSAANIGGLEELAADLGPIARRLQRC